MARYILTRAIIRVVAEQVPHKQQAKHDDDSLNTNEAEVEAAAAAAAVVVAARAPLPTNERASNCKRDRRKRVLYVVGSKGNETLVA